MIEFLDGAMAAYLSQMFNAFVIWSPADLSRQNLARKAQDKNRNDLGLLFLELPAQEDLKKISIKLLGL